MKFNINTLTIDELKGVIAAGNDSHANQLRITKSGEVFLSQDVGAQNLNNIAGRFETFDAHNGYVGPTAASDSKYIERLYNTLMKWKENGCSRTYIDVWEPDNDD